MTFFDVSKSFFDLATFILWGKAGNFQVAFTSSNYTLENYFAFKNKHALQLQHSKSPGEGARNVY